MHENQPAQLQFLFVMHHEYVPTCAAFSSFPAYPGLHQARLLGVSCTHRVKHCLEIPK